MSTDDNKEKKDEIVKANIIALQKNSSSLVRRAIQDIDVVIANPNLLIKPITKINPIDGAEMVWVQGGTFTMGSPDGIGYDNEHPEHQVTLSGYWMYKYEVTVAQYLAFCTATSHALPRFPLFPEPYNEDKITVAQYSAFCVETGHLPLSLEPYFLDEDEDEVTLAQYCAFCATTGHELSLLPGPYILDKDGFDNDEHWEYGSYSWGDKSGWDDPLLQQHPIVNVTWNDCKTYADWAKANLPTEAQWEYAARGPQGLNYPWGGIAYQDDPNNCWDESKCANYTNSYCQDISTWPIGSFPTDASWCGAQDMAGNAREWCADWYGNYSISPMSNPTGPASGASRVLRGGSWDYHYNNGRGAYRGYYGIPDYYYYIGFRCVSL